jgi:hypothetical protein
MRPRFGERVAHLPLLRLLNAEIEEDAEIFSGSPYTFSAFFY